MKFQFTEADKERIRNAVRSLEGESSGELVPYFVSSSDDYDEAQLISALIFTLLGVVSIGVLAYFWLLPSGVNTLMLMMYLFVMAIVGYFIPWIFPRLGILLINDEIQKKRVHQKAYEAFVKEEVFNTVDKTGILILISALEHKVIVLADSGINQKVQPEDWKTVVGIIINGIKHQNLTDGIVSAILECKKLLLANDFIVREDDTNELSDDLRIE